MRKIERKIEIQTSIQKAWGIISNFEIYPSLVPEVDRLEVLYHDPNLQTAILRVYSRLPFLGQEIIAEQKITYCPKQYKINFQQHKGKFLEFYGHRFLIDLGNKIEFHSCVNFLWDRTWTGEMMHFALEPIIIKNIEEMQKNVKKLLES